MFIISEETLNSAISLRENIVDPEQKARCVDDLESMICTKEAHLARAEWGSCCGNIGHLAAQIDAELTMLRSVLESLRSGDSAKASSQFENYIALVRRNYQPEQERL